MKKNTVTEILLSMGLSLEQVIEPDLNKQYENYILLCKILESEGKEREELLIQAELQINL